MVMAPIAMVFRASPGNGDCVIGFAWRVTAKPDLVPRPPPGGLVTSGRNSDCTFMPGRKGGGNREDNPTGPQQDRPVSLEGREAWLACGALSFY